MCGLSSCGSQALECRLSSCGARAYLLRGMWDLPRPGLEPVSPALAGGFLTTAPPGRSILNVSSQRRLKQLPPGRSGHSSLTPRLLLHRGFCCFVLIVVCLPRWNIHSLRVWASFVFITKPRTVPRIIRDIEKLSKRFVE